MNKTLIAGGIVAVAIVVSMAYGASMNPGGDEQRSGAQDASVRVRLRLPQASSEVRRCLPRAVL